MPNRQQSALYLTLPISPELTGMGGLIAGLLTNGSDETRRRSEALRQRNILISFTGLPDKLVAAVQGPAGRESEMAQGVLSLLCNPHWSPDDFERLRQNTAHLIEDEAKAPNTPLVTAMKRALYGPSQPYSLTSAERIAKMAAQTPPMLWMALQRSLSATPAAMLMMASSRPEHEQQAILNQAIRQSAWVGNPFLAATLPPIPATVAPSAFQGLLLTPNETLKRARIEVVWQVPPPGDRDYLAFLLLRHILGGQMKGSFFERLRTRDGLVYGVPTHSGSHLGGQFRYHASIEVDLDKIVPGEQALLAVAQEAALRPVAGDVLDTAKRNCLLELRSADQTSWRTLITAEPWLLCDRPPPSRQDMENAIANITADDIQRVAQRIFAAPDKLQLVGVSAPAPVLQRCFPGYPLTPSVP
jgi:predicted Zn-dependent peptidase